MCAVCWKCHGEGRMLEMNGRRCRLWWCGKGDGVGGVGVIVMEELFEKVVEVRRVSDRAMSLDVVLEEDLLRLISGYAPQGGRRLEQSSLFTMS